MKLFLASEFWQVSSLLMPLLPKPPKECTLALIPTAGDPYPDNKWWIENDLKKVREMGFKVFLLDLKKLNEKDLRKKIEQIDVVLVAGGNTFYLLEKVYKSGFSEVIKNAVKRGVVYIGSSAGSIIAGPDIEPVKVMDDPQEANLITTKGLNFIDFIILPHQNDKAHKEAGDKIVKEYKDKFSLLNLNDNEVVVLNGSELKIEHV